MESKKIAIITGSNKGIGLEFAKHLLGKGYTVIINSRHETSDSRMIIKKYKGICYFIKGDVSKEKDVKKIYNFINKNFKKIDLLINNVGDYLHKDILEITPKEFEYIVFSNLITTFNCSRILYPLIKNGGNIINMGYSSCEKITYSRCRVPYNISKTGVFILTKILANALSSKGIKVNIISPGVVENSKRKPHNLPFNKPATYKDLINALDFLLDKKSNYISGCNLDISGGFIPFKSL